MTQKTVTRADLVAEVLRTTPLSRKQAEDAVRVFFDGIIESLHEGHKIEIRGFGSFRLRRRAGRIARNPKRSGVRVVVPPKNIPYFKPGKRLRELLSQRGAALAAVAASASASEPEA